MSDAGGMNTDRSEPTSEAKAALARLHQAISDPEQRSMYLKDPKGTVEGYEQLPDSVRRTFEGMSHEELDLVARTAGNLHDAGFYVDTDEGRLGFF